MLGVVVADGTVFDFLGSGDYGRAALALAACAACLGGATGALDDRAILTQLRRGALEYCVLALLEHGELYGLEIARRLTADRILLDGVGTLYPLLARLRKAGLVDTNWRESSEGPPRRYYALTRAGHESLDAFRRTWKPFRDAVDNTLTRGTP